jgi:peroxiredoxin
MVVDNGMVKHLVVEEPGKFDFSDAKSILQQL